MDFQIGDIVYKAYSPSKVGRIVQIEQHPLRDADGKIIYDAQWRPRLSMPVYTVQRLDGTTFVAKSVESFETLVTEHERKAAKFRAILNQF